MRREGVRTRTGTGVCEGYDGIYHIQSGDVGGAAATIFFQFVLAQLIYAEQHNLKPWVFFNNISHHVYDQRIHNQTGTKITLQFQMKQGMKVYHHQDKRLRRAAYPGKPFLPQGQEEQQLHSHLFQFTGDGVWQNYFLPVSDFDPNTTVDPSCQGKPLVTMDIWSITPGLHIYAPWTPRMWRYHVLPDYMQQRHLTLREWLTPQRIRAHAMTQKYIQVQPNLWKMADSLLQKKENNNNAPCLGLHIRWSDKGGGRRIIQVQEFLPYIQQFVTLQQHQQQQTDKDTCCCIMLATDSTKVLDEIQKRWPLSIRQHLRFQGAHVLRSSDETPVFEMTTTADNDNDKDNNNKQQRPAALVSHHRTNTEVLVDILALSRCDFLIHGHSAVSDAAMYLNDKLIYQSVNLEDPDDFSVQDFGNLVRDIQQRGHVNLTRYFPDPWWNTTTFVEPIAPQATGSNQFCSPNNDGDEYRGILHISIGGGSDFSFGMTFFHFVLNQLLFADKYKLKPFIHLTQQDAQAVYDPRMHASNGWTSTLDIRTTRSVTVRNVSVASGGADGPMQRIYPSDVDANSGYKSTLNLSGNGIWNSYFEPVSDIDPRSEETFQSCRDKPWVVLRREMVTSGLHLWAPWSVKSFKYSGLPDQLWWKGKKTQRAGGPSLGETVGESLSDWYLPMRKKGHEIVGKYYRPHAFLWKRVEEVLQTSGAQTDCCLAMHIRQGDKEGYGKRKLSRIRDYKPFVEAFLNATHGKSFVYLATDAWRVIDAIQDNWDASLRSRIHSQGDHVVRSVRWVPAHMLEPDNRHRVNLEALVDTLAMSRCQFLLHGFSTMSEAAIYMNLNLHYHSVNLDDVNHMGVKEFEVLIRGNEFCSSRR
ncbi:glycosyltransferase family 15 protein [Seminavis robusta]|uniref:Glycosyltransferase family 15 protein n=1 Tax=Seminavis robusta TaxID=568900 RepID=A0A9N8H227_9STRA|nr:glycosyltransferase family 15 protein [Seminavis robusta]|eukprot:Sro3_g002300.1 glycosyltransferase family 15 protein (866) ;mRNA; f:112092-114689